MYLEAITVSLPIYILRRYSTGTDGFCTIFVLCIYLLVGLIYELYFEMGIFNHAPIQNVNK